MYDSEKNDLSYSVPENETLVNYLSLNTNRYEMLPDPKPCSQFESQAFKTAGKLFKVIDENTRDVIVPYNKEAEEIVSRLENGHENIPLLLRKAQKYTVGVYIGTERKLYENKALRDISCGAVILDRTHYNDEVGIDIEGAEKELLIF